MKRVAWPLMLSISLTLVYLYVRITGRTLLDEDSLNYLLAACLAGFGIVLVRCVSFLVFDVIFLKRKGREAPAVLRALLSIMAYSILFAVTCSMVLHINLTGLMTTSAAVTVLVGLALQETLGNFFAGVSIHTENPFLIKDTIRIREHMGKVESVTWRTTSIRTTDNSVVIFPNSVVAKEPLEIFHYDDLNRRVFRFQAPYSVPPQRVFAVAKECIRGIPDITAEIPPVVRLGELSDSAISYEILYWVRDYIECGRIDAAVRERIWYAFQRSEIDFPWPACQVFFDEKKPSDSCTYEILNTRMVEQIDIFESLTAKEKEAMVKASNRLVYAPKEIIVEAGEQGDSMYIILRGRVEVYLMQGNGGYQQVAVLGPGDYFGEMGLFTGEARSACVRALDESEVLEVKKEAIERLFCDNARLVESFSCKIAERRLALSQHDRGDQGDETSQSDTIMQKIKRFFNIA